MDTAALLARLDAIVGAKGLVGDDGGMAAYLTDWRGRSTGRTIAVVSPASTEEVSAVMRLASQAGMPVYPQGGNTGLCMGAVPDDDGRGIVLSLARMNRVRSIDKASSAIVVDAGAVLANVHAAAEDVGRTLPLFLGSEGSAQIGGLISTNAGGTGALRYGTMRDLVLGLEVVLADGAVWDGLSLLRKDNTGYDLKHLFIGAEGTLGVVTAAALKLFPALHARADAWVSVSGPEAAVSLLVDTQERFDTALQAFELVSGTQIEVVLEHVPGRRCPFTRPPRWSVMIELGSPDPSVDLTAPLEALLAGALDDGRVLDAAVAQSLSDAQEFWTVRHSVSEANKIAGHGVTLDICVPVSKVPEFIAGADALTEARFSEATAIVVCHLGDGNVHYIPMFDHDYWHGLDDPDGLNDTVLAAYHDLAARLGGSFSAEHGIGRKLTRELERLTAPRELALFRDIKRLFDPHGIMNPGALLKP